MKILVTGGAGFIGSHLVLALLREGHEVTVLDDFNDFYSPTLKRKNAAAFSDQAKVVEGDICNTSLVNTLFETSNFDCVVHLAARAGVRPSIQHPELYLKTNVDGTFCLLEAAKKSDVPQFLFASSSSVYGLAKQSPFSEDMALLQTLSPYAATKLAGEQLCGNFAYLYGMHAICLRFFTVYGPRQRPDLAIHKFVKAIDEGRPIPKFGDGSTRRDYTYIDDILQGILGALHYKGATFDIFNLGESETTTLNELISIIEETLGKKAIIESLPEQKGDMPHTCANISKARTLLNYDPQTKLSLGIKKFVEWYKEGNIHASPLANFLSISAAGAHSNS